MGKRGIPNPFIPTIYAMAQPAIPLLYRRYTVIPVCAGMTV